MSQPQLNSKVGFDTKRTLDHQPPPQTQCHQYISCSYPHFNQTLKLGLWDQQQLHEQQQEQQKQQFIYTDPILPKLLREGVWDTTTTKTITLSSTTTKQKHQQQIYLSYN